jgi:hypothetical protein
MAAVIVLASLRSSRSCSSASALAISAARAWGCSCAQPLDFAGGLAGVAAVGTRGGDGGFGALGFPCTPQSRLPGSAAREHCRDGWPRSGRAWVTASQRGASAGGDAMGGDDTADRAEKRNGAPRKSPCARWIGPINPPDVAHRHRAAAKDRQADRGLSRRSHREDRGPPRPVGRFGQGAQ